MSKFPPKQVDESRAYILPGKLLNRLLKVLPWLENLRVIGGTWTPSGTNAILKIDKAEDEDDEGTAHRSILINPSRAGVLYTAAEMLTAIENGYSNAGLDAKSGDILYSDHFNFLVGPALRPNGTGVGDNDIMRIAFTVNGEDFVAFQTGSRLQ